MKFSFVGSTVLRQELGHAEVRLNPPDTCHVEGQIFLQRIGLRRFDFRVRK